MNAASPSALQHSANTLAAVIGHVRSGSGAARDGSNSGASLISGSGAAAAASPTRADGPAGATAAAAPAPTPAFFRNRRLDIAVCLVVTELLPPPDRAGVPASLILAQPNCFTPYRSMRYTRFSA